MPLKMGPVIMSLEPRDWESHSNRRKDVSDKNTKAKAASKDGVKGNRRMSGGNATNYFRKLGSIALLAYMVGGPIMFLDSHGYISVPFIRHARTILHMKLADPKTVDTIEQRTGLKIISLEQHGELTKELNETKAKVAEKEAELTALAAKLAESKKGQPQFCGECKWEGRFSCEARKAFIIKRYGESEETVLANMLQLPQCQKAVERRLRGSHE
jgi:hypothetical protein